jgi:hypothetical protein
MLQGARRSPTWAVGAAAALPTMRESSCLSAAVQGICAQPCMITLLIVTKDFVIPRCKASHLCSTPAAWSAFGSFRRLRRSRESLPLVEGATARGSLRCITMIVESWSNEEGQHRVEHVSPCRSNVPANYSVSGRQAPGKQCNVLGSLVDPSVEETSGYFHDEVIARSFLIVELAIHCVYQ